MRPKRLNGKVALITGASRGIGRAIAMGFAGAGANVVVNYLGGDSEASEAVEAIESKGVESVAIRADVRRRKEVQEMVNNAIEAFGRIDILVNNAGVSASTPFLEISDHEWNRVIDTDLKGSFVCGQIVARTMVESGHRGRIINISSTRQEQAWPGNAHYCSAKGALRMLTRVMALELGRHGITVNSISPGTILTDMNRDKYSDASVMADRLARVPVGRLGIPDDLVGTALMLADDDASFVNGASIMVDGGQTLW